MYSQGEIEDAVAAGALAPEQAASLRAFVAAQNRTPHVSEEYFRLVRGYNDIFITIGCMLALTALGWLGALIPFGRRSIYATTDAAPFLQSLLVAAGAWGLAEIFTRQRRAALPSFALAFFFGFNAAAVGLGVATSTNILPAAIPLITGGSFAIGALATWAFWMRFRIPVTPMIALGLGVIAIAMILGFVLMRTSQGPMIINVIIFLIGIGLFVYAMSVDGEDRWRVTERSEVAFWLHGLAGLVLVVPLAFFLGLSGNSWSLVSGAVMVVLFLLFTILALVVDRKVYVASCLLPLGVALYSLFQMSRVPPPNPAYRSSPYGPDPYSAGPYGATPYGDPVAPAQQMINNLMLPVLIIAILMVLLAIFWAPLRRAVVGILPPNARASLPGTEASPLEQARQFE